MPEFLCLTSENSLYSKNGRPGFGRPFLRFRFVVNQRLAGMGSFKVIHRKGQVELIIAQIVGSVPVTQPGQLRRISTAGIIPQIDQSKINRFMDNLGAG